MGRPNGAGRDERVLVLMPTEKDARRTLAALEAGGLAGVACETLPGLCAEIAAGAGAVLLTEELIVRDEAGDRYRFLSVNDTFLRVSGYANDQVVGRPMEDVVPAANHDLVRARYRDVIDTRRPLVYVEAADLPAGRRFGEITLTPI